MYMHKYIHAYIRTYEYAFVKPIALNKFSKNPRL